MALGRMALGKMALGKIAFGKMALGIMDLGKFSCNQRNWKVKTAIAKCELSFLYMNYVLISLY